MSDASWRPPLSFLSMEASARTTSSLLPQLMIGVRRQQLPSLVAATSSMASWLNHQNGYLSPAFNGGSIYLHLDPLFGDPSDDESHPTTDDLGERRRKVSSRLSINLGILAGTKTMARDWSGADNGDDNDNLSPASCHRLLPHGQG